MNAIFLLLSLLTADSRALVAPDAKFRLALEQLKEAAGDAPQAAPAVPFRRPYTPFRGVNAGLLGPELPTGDSKDFPVTVTLWNRLLLPLADTDHDGDGLSDLGEAELAYAFRPFLVFDSHEDARPAGEPVTLFQVRAEGCVGPPARCGGLPLRVHLRYANLWTWDGGYGPASTFCIGDSHKGDNQPVTVNLVSADGGGEFRIETVENGEFIWPTKSGAVKFLGGTHPWIYFSAGKHHQFFDTAYDKGRASPYSAWACRENVDGQGFFDLAHLRAPKKSGLEWNNVGEPEAHPASHFISDLGAHRFPGEGAWKDAPFCGGLDCKPSNPTSHNAKIWRRDKFQIPE